MTSAELLISGVSFVSICGLHVFCMKVGAHRERQTRRLRQAEVAASELARLRSIPVLTEVIDIDVQGAIGGSILAGIACKVRRSPAAITVRVALDKSLSGHERAAMLSWATEEVDNFPISSGEDLRLRGWHYQGDGYWVLFHDDGLSFDGSLEFAATATVRGLVGPDQAAEIVERLREFTGSVKLTEDGVVEVHFTVCAESWYDALVRARSLTGELGYPVLNIDVLPM